MWPPPHLAYYPELFQGHPDPPDGLPPFFCAIVRGENWQLDTLPAALARTGISNADWEGSGSGDHPVE